jgi:serine/threonine protein kinase
MPVSPNLIQITNTLPEKYFLLPFIPNLFNGMHSAIVPIHFSWHIHLDITPQNSIIRRNNSNGLLIGSGTAKLFIAPYGSHLSTPKYVYSPRAATTGWTLLRILVDVFTNMYTHFLDGKEKCAEPWGTSETVAPRSHHRTFLTFIHLDWGAHSEPPSREYAQLRISACATAYWIKPFFCLKRWLKLRSPMV